MIDQRKNLPGYNSRNLKSARKIVSLALKNNKFYQKKFKTAEITKTINNWGDFYKLPFTTKEELVQDQINNPPFGTNYSCNKRDLLFFASTSGSASGEQLMIPFSQSDSDSCVKYWEWYMKYKGFNRNDTLFRTVTGLNIYLQGKASANSGMKTLFYSERGIPDLYQFIKKFGVTVLISFPTELFLLIKYAEKNNEDLRQLKLKKLITNGELAWNDKKLRKIVEKKFNIEWHDEVASQETWYTGHSCSKCEQYHFLSNSKIIEIVDPETGLHSDHGEIIETSLMRVDNPYIRYRTSDLTKLSYSPKCKQFTFKGITGRSQDMTTFMVRNLNKKYIDLQIKQINPSNTFFVLIVKRDFTDSLDIFYETRSEKDLLRLEKFSQEFSKQYKSGPNIFILPEGTIPVKEGRKKIKTIYDLRSKEFPKSNYNHLYTTSRNYQIKFKTINKLRKIRRLYEEILSS